MRYKIEKNTVQETLVIPLYARKMCTELFPDIYRDKTAAGLLGVGESLTLSASVMPENATDKTIEWE